MRTRKRRIGVVTLLALVAGAVAFLLPVSPASAGTATNTNACLSNATGTYSDLPVTLSGDGSPNPASLGVDTVTLSNQSLQVNVPGDLFVAGYNLGLLVQGVNNIPADANVNIDASNTVEGSSTEAVSTVAQTTITDPDGIPGNGDESATPLAVNLPLTDTTWTPTGGDIVYTQGGFVVDALVAGGIITVTLSCESGTSSIDGTTFTPAVPAPFETVTVIAPPTAPTCSDANEAVGAGQGAVVDPATLCSDVNGNVVYDDTTVAVTTAPTAGTATVNPDGTISYSNTDTAATADSFQFTVTDDTALTSAPATVNVSILGNLCDATAGACQLTQIISVEVIGTTLSMEQAGQFVQLTDVVLNGAPQVATGAIQPVVVTNARGDAAAWNVTGYATDIGAPGGPTFDLDQNGDGVPDTTVPDCGWIAGSPDRLCIPGDNLGWGPSAQITHDQIPGDVAAVNAGPANAADAADWLSQLIAEGAAGNGGGIGGLLEQNLLCGAPVNQSGGTFQCDAALYLGVPASAGAATYSGGLVLTLL